jgi:hypothetical protein
MHAHRRIARAFDTGCVFRLLKETVVMSLLYGTAIFLAFSMAVAFALADATNIL